MKQPKPFHIGTRVHDTQRNPCRVMCCLRNTVVIAYDASDGFPEVLWQHEKHALIHADDGSPLGEWVPINPDYEVVHRWEDPETGEEVDLRTINVQDVNAIIRGEVEQ